MYPVIGQPRGGGGVHDSLILHPKGKAFTANFLGLSTKLELSVSFNYYQFLTYLTVDLVYPVQSSFLCLFFVCLFFCFL